MHVEPGLSLSCREPEGQRRLQTADDRINRSIAEQIEEQDQVPPVHGGSDDMPPVAPDADLKFEDSDAPRATSLY